MAEPIRVLVAEDEFFIAFTLTTLLERTGHQVVGTARDGTQAVALASKLRPDAVLMDIGMPGMDGVAATRQIMDRCPTPVVILSAYHDRKRVSEALEAGAVAYLLKPVAEEDLRRAIAQAVDPAG